MYSPIRSCLPILGLMVGLAGCTPTDTVETPMPRWTATRSETNPLLTTASEGMVEEHGYANVNGPSVIRVPAWADSALGKYYMYFAHHRGSFIRLAYADQLEGPWTVSRDTVLDLRNTPALDHIASPDVHVDEEAKRILMFFHSVDDTTRWVQTTYLATSDDGLTFQASSTPVGPPYMRAFRIGYTWWAVAKVRGGPGGVLMRALDPEGEFHIGPRILPGMRHAAVFTEGNTANVIFSRIGDKPERLLLATFNPNRRWIEPKDGAVSELLRPEFDYEGADLPIEESEVGEAQGRVHALRDPYVFTEDGRHYLFYSIAGESGIAMARLEKN